MNKALAKILRDQVKSVPFIDKFAGLVYTAEYQETINEENSEIGRTIIKRVPASCDIFYSNASLEKYTEDCLPDGSNNTGARDLVPNQAFKGILYFEDNGVSATGKENDLFRYRSRLRLVTWINTNWIKNNTCTAAAAILMNAIIKKIDQLQLSNVEPFIRLVPTVEAIPRADVQIFNPYTYNLHDTQYILPPFEFFAIDLGIEYLMHESCIELLDMRTELEYNTFMTCE